MRLITTLLLGATFIACGEKTEDTSVEATEETAEPSTEPAGEPSGEPSSEDTETTGDAPEELGKGLYESKCMGCHGADATGVSAPSLLDKPDEAFFNAVQNGIGYMSPIPDVTEEDIGNIIAYVRSL